MLPYGYVDLDWAENPEDTLKPLTGPKKTDYKTAWELDLFPRIANPEDYEMIYKEVSKSNDKRPLLPGSDLDDSDQEEFVDAAVSSQVLRFALQQPALGQLVKNINAAKKAFKCDYDQEIGRASCRERV